MNFLESRNKKHQNPVSSLLAPPEITRSNSTVKNKFNSSSKNTNFRHSSVKTHRLPVTDICEKLLCVSSLQRHKKVARDSSHTISLFVGVQ